MTVQVTNASEHAVEIRFLMGADSPNATFDLRCYVREKLIEYLQQNYPGALPHARADVTFFEKRK